MAGLSFQQIQHFYNLCDSDESLEPDDPRNLDVDHQDNNESRRTADFMLQNSAVMRYLNDEIWFDLHPALYDIPGIQDALYELQRLLSQKLHTHKPDLAAVVALPHLDSQHHDPIALVFSTIQEAPEATTKPLYYLLDASDLSPDEDRWAELFARLNLHRNSVTRYLQRPLLLLLCDRAYHLMSHYATDLLSIKSSLVDLGAQPPEKAPGGRLDLLEALLRLLPAQFELLVFKLGVDSVVLPGQQAPQAERAIALLKHQENLNRVDELKQALSALGVRIPGQ